MGYLIPQNDKRTDALIACRIGHAEKGILQGDAGGADKILDYAETGVRTKNDGHVMIVIEVGSNYFRYCGHSNDKNNAFSDSTSWLTHVVQLSFIADRSGEPNIIETNREDNAQHAHAAALDADSDDENLMIPSAGEITLRLPNVLKELEDEAFYGNKMAIVYTPDCCHTIGAKAFANCSNLMKVYIGMQNITIADDAFKGSNHVVIFAPKDSDAQKYAERFGIPFMERN